MKYVFGLYLSLLNRVGGVGSWVAWVAWVRECVGGVGWNFGVGGVSQKKTWVA